MGVMFHQTFFQTLPIRGHLSFKCPVFLFIHSFTLFLLSLLLRLCEEGEILDSVEILMMAVFFSVIFMVVMGVVAGGYYPPPGTRFPEPGYYGPSRPGHEATLPRGQVVRVLTKANPDFWLAIRDGSAVLVHANSNDDSQQWVMDETYSNKVKDEAGYPSFALVNKATGQALKHGLEETQPVLLTPYEPNKFDVSIHWTTSGDMRQGFRTIRPVNNIHLNLDAFQGDKKSGGIKDGNPVVLWLWDEGDNQLWKIV